MATRRNLLSTTAIAFRKMLRLAAGGKGSLPPAGFDPQGSADPTPSLDSLRMTVWESKESHPRFHRRRLATQLLRCTVVLTASGMIAAGCSDDSEPGAADEPVNLRMVMWSANEGHHELFDSIAADYVAENELVESVEFEALTGGEYMSALTTQIAGGDPPDLAWISEGYAAQFVDTGVLRDVAPVLRASETYNFDDVIDGAIERWSSGDGVFAYPFSNSPFGVYVNLDLVEAAGQPNPADLLDSGEWTWDKAVEIAEAAVEPDGTGIVTSTDFYTLWDQLAPIWAAWGARPWSEDGTTCEFTSPEMTDFYSWVHEMAFDREVLPKPGESYSFASGDAVFQVSLLSASGGLDDSFNWDFIPLPAGPAGQHNVVGQAGVGVLERGRHPDIAADFLEYFTNEANSARLAKFFPPPRHSLLNVETLQASASALTEEQIQRTIVDVVPTAVIKPGHKEYSGISGAVRAGLDELWVPGAEAADVLDTVCADIERWLGE